ncbi:MAG: precorrin-8X methylmutase [Methanomicrobiales archaeon]|nr:precorrin-8X methylmutase [Methanomicrobiales archaeon]
MYTDLGAETREAYEISKKSRRFARHMIGDRNDEDRIRQRCAIAVGDLSMADLVRFTHDPVPAGLSALEKRSPLITDIRMVQVGIQKKGHESPVHCVLDRDSTPLQNQEITRTSAGFLSYGDELEGCIIVIGNAPSALLTVCRMMREGVLPALVIGTPVGFVNACESKEMLRSLDVPSISTAGTRGGTPVAVAAMNEIVTLYVERKGIHHEADR